MFEDVLGLLVEWKFDDDGGMGMDIGMGTAVLRGIVRGIGEVVWMDSVRRFPQIFAW